MRQRNPWRSLCAICCGVILLLGVFFSFRFVLATIGIGLIVWGCLCITSCR